MPTPRSPSRRVALRVALGVIGLVCALAIGGLVWLRTADLKGLLERQASQSLDRNVTVEGLAIRWGSPLKIEVTDLRIANAPWGSDPEMVRVGELSALLDPWALLRGVVRYERLRIADAKVVLERDPGGRGNWKFGGSEGGFALVPKDRAQFPTLIDFAGERGLITYRTRSGAVLTITLDQAAISSPDDVTPVRLVATGAYNDVALELDATTESFGTLRDATLPFPMRFTLNSPDSQVAFEGTATEPLDFDGVRGAFTLDAARLGDIARALGMKRKVNLPLSIAGGLARNGDLWSLSAAKGTMMEDSDFSGSLALLEGGPREPDDITLALDFTALDADALSVGLGGRRTGFAATSLRTSDLAGVNLTADLRATTLTLAERRLHDVSLESRIADGKAMAKDFSFDFGGGRLISAGTLEDGRLTLDARLVRAQMKEIARALGAEGDEIAGRVDGAARLRMQGNTIGAALKDSAGALVLAVRGGTVDRGLVEGVSADLRSLFREEEGRVPLSCLLGVMVVKDGIGVISPLRLESAEAVVLGGGKVDLKKRTVELTLKTVRDSTNFFALDIPVRVGGPFARVRARPAPDANVDWLDDAGSTTIGTLPSDLERLAEANRCAP